MAYGQIDPARLEGDALTRWYLRSPDNIEQERQEAAAQRYQDFFGGNRGGDPDPGFDAGLETSAQEVDPGFKRGTRGVGRKSTPSSTGFRSVPTVGVMSARPTICRRFRGPILPHRRLAERSIAVALARAIAASPALP